MREEWNGSRVCPECFETKHPQLDPPIVRADAEALRDARPDVDETAPNLTAYNDFINGLP
jgi:Fe-S-cluster formation regulator IscX/YfhJ